MSPDASIDTEAVKTALAEEPVEQRTARRRVVALIQSLEEHCVAADEALSTLAAALPNDPSTAQQRAADAVEACAHVATPLGPLEETLSKLLVEPRPDLISPELTPEYAEDVLAELERTTRDLSRTVGSLPAQIRSADDPATRRAVGRQAKSARRTVTTIDDLARELRRLVCELFHDGHVDDLQSALAEPEGLAPSDGEEMGGESMMMASGEQIEPMEELSKAVVEELRPEPRLTDVRIDRSGLADLREREDPLAEIMASPTIERAMWSELADIDQEYFLPGVGEIPGDSVGLLETNTAVIEAYMLGLNHEFAETLRWRRYPTDLRGTYFRQFWDHRIDPDVESSDPDAVADIQKLHEWSGGLGSNQVGDDRDTLVLLVKGELLRRYPNTVIYAAKAIKSERSESEMADESDRIPAVPESAVDGTGSSTDRMFPEFSGRLDPDIMFFGFDLDEDQARYATEAGEENPDNEDPEADDAGWFFVLEEPPAEPRFGLQTIQDDDGEDNDTEEGEEPHEPMATPGEYVTLSDPPSWMGEYLSDVVYYGDEPTPEWDHNSAHMAEITWRTPVRVAIHASEMLPEE